MVPRRKASPRQELPTASVLESAVLRGGIQITGGTFLKLPRAPNAHPHLNSAPSVTASPARVGLGHWPASSVHSGPILLSLACFRGQGLSMGAQS